jgi:hypothetical protein
MRSPISSLSKTLFDRGGHATTDLESKQRHDYVPSMKDVTTIMHQK